MLAPDFHDLSEHSDILRIRDGRSVTVRFVEPNDLADLQAYFRGLSSSPWMSASAVVFRLL